MSTRRWCSCNVLGDRSPLPDEIRGRTVGRDFVDPTQLHQEFGQLAFRKSLGPVDRTRDVQTASVALAASEDLGPPDVLAAVLKKTPHEQEELAVKTIGGRKQYQGFQRDSHGVLCCV